MKNESYSNQHFVIDSYGKKSQKEFQTKICMQKISENMSKTLMRILGQLNQDLN